MTEFQLVVLDVLMTEWSIVEKDIQVQLKEIKVNVNTNFVFFEPEQIVRVTIKLEYFEEKKPQVTLVNCSVRTDVLITQKSGEKINKQTDVPDPILISIISMAISHSRAIFLSEVKKTVYKGLLLPVTNPVEIYESLKKHFNLATEEKE